MIEVEIKSSNINLAIQVFVSGNYKFMWKYPKGKKFVYKLNSELVGLTCIYIYKTLRYVSVEPGWLSRYNDGLQTGELGFDS
jgi:hypothetical protein